MSFVWMLFKDTFSAVFLLRSEKTGDKLRMRLLQIKKLQMYESNICRFTGTLRRPQIKQDICVQIGDGVLNQKGHPVHIRISKQNRESTKEYSRWKVE